jgi:hypothetical protein
MFKRVSAAYAKLTQPEEEEEEDEEALFEAMFRDSAFMMM